MQSNDSFTESDIKRRHIRGRQGKMKHIQGTWLSATVLFEEIKLRVQKIDRASHASGTEANSL